MVVAALEGLEGLDDSAVAERLADGRSNAFTPASSRSIGSILRANLLTLFNAIIVTCFVVLIVIGRWQDALFGLSALANAVIGAVQEFRAKRTLDRLALISAADARVVRGGETHEVAVASVVLDDVLVLRTGDQVAADATVLVSAGLQVDESMLTGESDPVDKTVDAAVLSGSIVVGGSGIARATRVGADSFSNRFADEARKFSLVSSELRDSINRVLRWISWLVLPLAALILNSQMLVAGGWQAAVSSGHWVQAAVGTVASVVSMIPLGLVLITSITFAVGAVKLARSQVLMQELAAVEGLARVDLICLDKTGTLTQGDMVFDHSYPLDPDAAPGWQQVLAWYGAQPDGNATARCLAVPYPSEHELVPSGTIPFTSALKWSSVSFAAATGAPTGTWVLGGPEMVFRAGSAAQMTAKADELARSGRRTLVLAYTPQGADGSLDHDALLTSGLIAVALLTFREHVRPDAHETLAYFGRQGVAVRIISGDNPHTVAAVAREVGIDAPSGFDARQLPEDDAQLRTVLAQNLVFGRVTPEQKKRIVIALKAMGHTVAMTGDGVNDALAIKEADVGIAMNSGSPATKAVARMILLDGRFSHLPGVVAEGRQVIANVERVSMLFLTKTVYAIGLAIVFGVLVLEFPFLPRQLSVTDGLTIGLPAFFLALLPNARRYEPGFLARSLSFAIPAGVVITVALSIYTRAALDAGIAQPELRTGSTLVLSLVGIWVLVVLSRPLTAVKTGVIGLMMIGLILVYAIPLARDFVQLVNPSVTTAAFVVVTSVSSVLAIEVVRFVHRRVLTWLAARRSALSVLST
ncbi:MAG: HAD-IC family P-type ATPase [Pseudolysinimonas sp.]